MPDLLTEPETDADRARADQTLAEAMQARAALGPAPGPDAEALALRALIDGAPDASLLPALRAVWGRLDATRRPAVIVHGVEAQAFAADRFGLNFRLAADAASALSQVKGRARALIGLDERAAGPPWWGRLLARPDARIIAAFPDSPWGAPRALMVSTETTGPTGDDRTFWVTDTRLDDGRIAGQMSEKGLAASLISQGGGLKLFGLAGYVQADDDRLAEAPGELTGVIGAAPLF